MFCSLSLIWCTMYSFNILRRNNRRNHIEWVLEKFLNFYESPSKVLEFSSTFNVLAWKVFVVFNSFLDVQEGKEIIV